MQFKEDLDINTLIKQYEICVNMADKISQRRLNTNNFFSALITSYISGLFIAYQKHCLTYNSLFAILFLGLLGLLFCIIWELNIDSYNKLNGAKFYIINKIEERLPFQPFEEEWNILKGKDNNKKYIPLTKVESFVPFILGIPFFGLIIYSIISYVTCWLQ